MVSAFTPPLTGTLGLATFRIMTVPAPQMCLFEALIAISIAYLAI